MKHTRIVSAVLFAASAGCSSGSTTTAPPGSSATTAGAHSPADNLPSISGVTPSEVTSIDHSDGGDPGTANLPPEDPQCINHTGDGGKCWGEWLKEPGTLTFTPVAKGELGAGPWPTTPVVKMGGAEGLAGHLQGVSVDTAQNIYAVSDSTLFIRRVGAATFEKYDRGTNGLRDFPFLSVAGAGPGIVYVGHVGNTPDSEFNDPPTDSVEVRTSGDMERIELTPTGIAPVTLDTHNSNSQSGAFDHMRTINNIVIPRRGPAAGEVFLSSEHAVTRYHGDKYADHRHISVDYGGSTHYGAAKALTVAEDGTMWYGSDYEFGGLAWTPRLYEWYFTTPWMYPTNAYGSAEEQDLYEGIGVDSKGGVWAAARGHGLVHMTITGHHTDLEKFDLPSGGANDLVVDTDDTVWVGTDGGLFRFDPTSHTWTQLNEAGGGIMHVFLDDTVTPRAIYAGGSGGLVVYRGQ